MPLARDISLTELGKRYPRLQDDADFIYAVGTSAQECDSSLKALSFFRDLADRFPQSPLAEEALYQSAMLQLKLGKTRSADSLFSLYSKMAPRGRFNPSALITRAKMAPPESAIPLLEDLRSRFGYSVLADSGGTLLGDLYLDVKRFKDAAALFEEMVRRDSLSAVGESVGLKMPYGRQSNSAYLKWANACENLGQFKKARQLYLRYGRRASASGDRGNLYAALSRMCEKQDNLVQAASYLGLAADVQPSDSIFHALGSFYFRSGHYAEAVTAWNRGIELTSRYSMKSLLKAKLLIAEIRQDRTVQMETRIKEFEKTFNNDPTIKELTSELNLELAKSYTRQKDFDLALKCIKEVQRNKDSAFYPESEVETGKILLITNKIDKALELLTDLPRKYPKHPILGAVYLNLGDHYFRSQQFDNSLSAFKKAASDTADKTVSATAMRYLIKIYDALQMWDAALATTRRYIQRFPKAEDILEKRIQIGVFSANVKEYFVALDAFRDAQKDATDDTEAEIQYWIGKCYYEMGQFEEAVLEFLKVKYVSKPTQLPWAATALYEAGTTYMRMKNRDNARKMFQKIVTSEGPASDLGRIAVKRIQEIDGGGP
jgi:tetratricopeptide (TPR) repeat protein